MTPHYLAAPILSWVGAGFLKFLINSIKQRRLAFDGNGNGGFPSVHTAIVISVAALIAFEEGMGHPAFGVAVALALIVMLDAKSLRREVGEHAEVINRLAGSRDRKRLRERMGHTRIEIAGGIVTGILTAAAIHLF